MTPGLIKHASWLLAAVGSVVLVSPARGTCGVAPTDLDFGTSCCGESYNYVQETFTITNNGTGELTGTVSESCDHYSIHSGGGPYTLQPDETRTVTVNFQPTAAGEHQCTVETGNELCDDVFCHGVGDETCDVWPQWFADEVCVGTYVDNTFTITNNDDTEGLSGNVSQASGHPRYSITQGGGPYTLAPAEIHTVVVRYTPNTAGVSWERIETGNGLCCDVYMLNQGLLNCCSVPITSLDFGNVAVGDSADREFYIGNNGPEPLSVNVSESCQHYDIISGGGSYSIPSSEMSTVTVRFEPTSTGPHGCTIDTGSAVCSDDVSCAGWALPPPVLTPYMSSLDLQLGSLPSLGIPALSGAETRVNLASNGMGGHNITLNASVWSTLNYSAGGTSLYSGVPLISDIRITAKNQAGSFASSFSHTNFVGDGSMVGPYFGGEMRLSGQMILSMLGGVREVFFDLAHVGGPAGGTTAATVFPDLTIDMTLGPWVTGAVPVTGITTNVVSATGMVGAGITLGLTPSMQVRTLSTGGGYVSTGYGLPLEYHTVTISGTNGLLSSNEEGTVTLVAPMRVDTTADILGRIPATARTTLSFVFVPEPGTLFLLVTGAVGLAVIGRRRLRR